MGWSDFDNGALLMQAESSFDILITTDKNLRYQQNLRGRLAIIVLPEPTWVSARQRANQVLQACTTIKPGDYLELQW